MVDVGKVELLQAPELPMTPDAIFQEDGHWTRMSILNTASSGRFSTDRTIRDYDADIWKTDPIQLDSK